MGKSSSEKSRSSRERLRLPRPSSLIRSSSCPCSHLKSNFKKHKAMPASPPLTPETSSDGSGKGRPSSPPSPIILTIPLPTIIKDQSEQARTTIGTIPPSSILKSTPSKLNHSSSNSIPIPRKKLDQNVQSNKELNSVGNNHNQKFSGNLDLELFGPSFSSSPPSYLSPPQSQSPTPLRRRNSSGNSHSTSNSHHHLLPNNSPSRRAVPSGKRPKSSSGLTTEKQLLDLHSISKPSTQSRQQEQEKVDSIEPDSIPQSQQVDPSLQLPIPVVAVQPRPISWSPLRALDTLYTLFESEEKSNPTVNINTFNRKTQSQDSYIQPSSTLSPTPSDQSSSIMFSGWGQDGAKPQDSTPIKAGSKAYPISHRGEGSDATVGGNQSTGFNQGELHRRLASNASHRRAASSIDGDQSEHPQPITASARAYAEANLHAGGEAGYSSHMGALTSNPPSDYANDSLGRNSIVSTGSGYGGGHFIGWSEGGFGGGGNGVAAESRQRRRKKQLAPPE